MIRRRRPRKVLVVFGVLVVAVAGYRQRQLRVNAEDFEQRHGPL